ncbi:MAG: Flp pilus assembly complex ATPase component TadA [Acidimicrobiia bacterium]|nr:Flp pilus assembly complex ATPase component TadA [Acidimicrobiia bacterium]MBT8246604.1 Flp pilus assembly complex ATPase component TadA [Acidimicrobiia bacterium]NNJ46997.1 CpaF family protein [Acidimicrobiia bacterium]
MNERIADRLIEAGIPLDRRALAQAARRLLAEEAPLAGPGVVNEVVDGLVGLGPIEELLRDPTVSDVLVNQFDDIWVERAGRLEPTTVRFSSPEAVTAAVERVIAPLGLRLDRASPAVDARLPDGSRLHAIVPPISIDGPAMAVRRFTDAVPTLDALVSSGAIRPDGAEFLRAAVAERSNLVVTGGTGAGKTTLLNILSKEIPGDQRVVTVEDAAELTISGHCIRLEARPANSDGAGQVSLEQLLRHALRLRPDRIIVGEVRGPEAIDLVAAMTTGHDGSMGTVHASTEGEALARLETLALSGERRVPASTLRRQIRDGVDVLVLMARQGGERVVAAISEVGEDGVRVLYEC